MLDAAGRCYTLLSGHRGRPAPRRSAAAGSRAPGQPSARGAELEAASPRAAHYSSVTGEAAAPGRSQVPDWIAQIGLSSRYSAYFGWRLLRPKGELWCISYKVLQLQACANSSGHTTFPSPCRCAPKATARRDSYSPRGGFADGFMLGPIFQITNSDILLSNHFFSFNIPCSCTPLHSL
ncbi:hypothetical protein H8959_022112 [Pygathrix nigripes]